VNKILFYMLAVVLAACTRMCRDCMALETISSGWNVVDVGEGMKPAFDFDADDNIHLMAFSPNSFDVLYDSAPSITGAWDLRSVANGSFYGPGDLVVDQNGVSHLAWHDHGFDGGSPNHLTINSAGTVTDFPIVAPGHNGWDNALAVDNVGVVHQSSINPSGFGAPDGLEYGKFDGSGWPGYDSIAGTGQVMYGFATDIDIDSNNFAHMVYSQATLATEIGDLNYVQDSAGGFSITTIVDDGISRFVSIAVDFEDRPHIAWLEFDPADTTTGSVMYGVLENSSWTFETVAASIANVDIFQGRKQVSLVLDDNDQPHIVYGEQRSINYATKAGSSWNSVIVASSNENIYNGLVILRLNSLDQPTIAFFNASNLVRLATLDSSRPDGDFNESGLVDASDLNLVLFNWNVLGQDLEVQAPAWTFMQPDDGVAVGATELNKVLFTWNESLSLTATVPEPSGIVVPCMGAMLAVSVMKRK